MSPFWIMSAATRSGRFMATWRGAARTGSRSRAGKWRSASDPCPPRTAPKSPRSRRTCSRSVSCPASRCSRSPGSPARSSATGAERGYEVAVLERRGRIAVRQEHRRRLRRPRLAVEDGDPVYLDRPVFHLRSGGGELGERRWRCHGRSFLDMWPACSGWVRDPVSARDTAVRRGFLPGR
jgi:hypothetical protein